MSMYTQANLPGFTEAQNDELEVLASDLGIDGLTVLEQKQIQARA